jgi:hypothetical protein
MSAVLMHHNETIFPNSHSFLPERWADASDRGRSLERYLVSFSKGSRQCIGIKYFPLFQNNTPCIYTFTLYLTLYLSGVRCMS